MAHAFWEWVLFIHDLTTIQFQYHRFNTTAPVCLQLISKTLTQREIASRDLTSSFLRTICTTASKAHSWSNGLEPQSTGFQRLPVLTPVIRSFPNAGKVQPSAIGDSSGGCPFSRFPICELTGYSQCFYVDYGATGGPDGLR